MDKTTISRSATARKLTRCKCENCGSIFNADAHEVKRGKAGRFCSKSCVNYARTYKRKSLAQKFWEKVNKSDAADCWLWLGTKSARGYGKVSDDWRSPPLYAHRVSYELHHGKIPPGMHVMHSCDNPGCVNPRHLSVGTALDNMLDKVFKDRSFFKLPAGDVRAIRQQHAAGKTCRELATMHNVHISTIQRTVSRRRRPRIQ
ncbi:endonuclease [Caudoviricetes sp.]|nr:endonuclease [Caudoviricetes sp.]